MDKEMEERIKKNLNLIGEREKTGDWSKLINLHDNVWGHADNIRGDISGIKGDVTNIKGDVTNISGYVTNIWGDVTDIIKVLSRD